MIKISVFAEGQTERIFLEKFFDEYLSPLYTVVESNKYIGDNIKVIRRRNSSGAKIYVLIYEVSGGERVVSALLERAERMVSEGYNKLIALRDLYPMPRQDMGAVIRATQAEFDKRTYQNKLAHVLAIMETEAWFLADHNLFARINPILTPEYIQQETNLDLVNGDPENFNKPSADIDKIYRLIQERYRKRERQTHRIVHNIDYAYLCSLKDSEPTKIGSFFYFLKCLDDALQVN